MKKQRQEKILELITKYEIDTHEDMIARLCDEGYNVTQATISRDMRDLRLTKVLTSRGTYKYAVNSASNQSNSIKLNNAVVDSIISVEYAGNNIVIKTYPGLAQAVASGVDSLNNDSILGCVGGDDTIIVVTRDAEASAHISETIRELMKTI